MSKHAKYRDAVTGNYVSREYAEANPETTVRERDWRVADLARRLADLEAEVKVLKERND